MNRRQFVVSLLTGTALVTPATAQIVYDPTNYAQNVLQAARALQQINNQISSLQNEAQMLVNQAKSLAKLPYSALQELQSALNQTRQLLGQAQRIAFNVQDIDRAFRNEYGGVTLSTSAAAMVTHARSRWQNTVSGLQDALRVQAGVVGNIESNMTLVEGLVDVSQSAEGGLQVAQAGNQLLALQSQQLADVTALLAANGRAQSLEAAGRASAAEQGREQRRRFLTGQKGYQSGGARMYQN